MICLRELELYAMKWIAPVFLTVFAAGCAGTTRIQSEEFTESMFVDGDLSDWSGSLHPLPDGPLRMGVRHDDQNIYVSIQTIDETLLQKIMMGGLTLWLNSDGDKSRQKGIRFPIGRSTLAPIRVDRDNPPTVAERRPQLFSVLEIIDEDGIAARHSIDTVPGLDVQAYLEFGSFSYEVQISINSTSENEFSIDPGVDGLLGLGLETGEIDMSSLSGSEQQGGDVAAAGGGGRGGGRGGRGGGRGGGGAGRGPAGGAQLDPIQIWTQVSLFAIEN